VVVYRYDFDFVDLNRRRRTGHIVTDSKSVPVKVAFENNQNSNVEWLDEGESPSTPIQGDNGWVKVEDGLPPKESKFYYWLYSKSIDNYEQGDYDFDRKIFVDKYGDRLFHVTHWKIPTPPKQITT